MPSDIEIAQAATLKPIVGLVKEKLGIEPEFLEPYGHYKAKVDTACLKDKPRKGKLVLMTAMSPTPAGEGKTTTTVGLADGLNHIGHLAMPCLREPSLGPCFGMKGGAAGGGYAQVVPMEDINLHFTGDFHAIGAAHNLLCAVLDNHLQQGNALNIDPRLITLKRVVDMNDRALRKITIGMGGTGNGVVREDGYDIVVASEVMAIVCLATSIDDLKARLARMVVAYTSGPVESRKAVTVADLKVHGAMAALLKDALKPNAVQTIDGNVAFIHGGPFANIAHGCNSVLATDAALRLCDIVVTEAGFGADLGAEKFVDIKCRYADLRPSCAVLVTTCKALKYHGGCAVADVKTPDVGKVEAGLPNLEKHLKNIMEVYNLPCVVSINHFTHDTDAEVACVRDRVQALGATAVLAKHWADGGKGAADLARAVWEVCQKEPSPLTTVYGLDVPYAAKIEAVVSRVYGGEAKLAANAAKKCGKYDRDFPGLPICIAKTQMSFTTDPAVRGGPSGHTVEIKDVKICTGAGFVVVYAGEIMTMPGLPKVPAAEHIDLTSDGKITGLF